MFSRRRQKKGGSGNGQEKGVDGGEESRWEGKTTRAVKV